MSNLLGKGNLGKGGLAGNSLGNSLGKGGFAKGGLGGSSKAPAKKARATAPDAPLLAMSLLGRWGRVAQGHVAFGGGCSCAGGMGPIHMSQMELHVMDYLAAKYADNAPIQVLLVERAEYKPNESGNLGEVLKAIATREAEGVSSADQLALLADLTRSIDSLDEITRGA
ncbi:MAG: hypothetical protein ACKVQK_09970 [Burkholderiales bacterium]